MIVAQLDDVMATGSLLLLGVSIVGTASGMNLLLFGIRVVGTTGGVDLLMLRVRVVSTGRMAGTLASVGIITRVAIATVLDLVEQRRECVQDTCVWSASNGSRGIMIVLTN